MTDNQNEHDRTVDGPTVYGPNAGQYIAPPHDQLDEPTTPGHRPTGPADDEPTTGSIGDEPTATTGSDEPTTNRPPAAPPAGHQPADPTIDEPTVTTGTDDPTAALPPTTAPTNHQPANPTTDEPTITIRSDDPAANQPPGAAQTSHQPVDAAGGEDEPTAAVGTGEPTTTGPTVGSWPFDQFEPPPLEELVWQAESPPPEPPRGTRSPAYYVSLGAAVVLVVGLVALAAMVAVMRPQREVAGTAVADGIPEITGSGAPPAATTATTPPPSGPFAELAVHPLSSSTTRMADTTCELPRFDPADDRQAAFYAAAKVCADNAWRPILGEAGLDGTVTVVTLTGPAQTQSCGELAPTSPATECDGTVYLTPAYLRDTEQNDRYPGRYLGVFLREYVRALQFTTGIDELVASVRSGAAEDLDERLTQQATCLAGVVSGAMAGQGAVDSNITGEIRDRMSTKDAPPDAKAWLDKGFQQRTPAACNTWVS